MYDALTLILIICAYIALLFLLAWWVERGSPRAKRLASHPAVYTLAIAIYATSWTYYGCVESAATSGMLFLALFLGATLGILAWWSLLRKLVRIKETQHITDIADLISARYGKSPALAALATLVALVGILPYVALQLQSILSTFSLLAASTSPASRWIFDNIGLIVVALLTLFTIFLGVRRLDPTERHPGLVTTLAVQSILKLLALLAVGAFIVYFMYNGFDSLFQRLAETSFRALPGKTGQTPTDYFTWLTYLLLSASAILFLPRQFHVAVIENPNQNHIRTAMWLLPLYLLLINIFIFPIAAAGLLQGYPATQAHTFTLLLPLRHAQPWLTLLVFLGGFTAAISMVIVETVTLSTMFTNHLLVPLLDRLAPQRRTRGYLLQARWIAIALIILTGYWFHQALAETYTLDNLGIISFAAALQFAPPILLGLYWPKATRPGAIAGLTAGFLLWLYTTLFPSFIHSGWLPLTLLENGPWGLAFLKPEALFGLAGLPPITHSVIWSLFFNLGLLILISLFTEDDRETRLTAEAFVNALRPTRVRQVLIAAAAAKTQIDPNQKRTLFEEVLARYLTPTTAAAIVEKSAAAAGLQNKPTITVIDLAGWLGAVETTLAGIVGAASAHQALTQAGIFTLAESEELAAAYTSALASASTDDLQKIENYYRQREALLAAQAAQLENTLADRSRALQTSAQVSRYLTTLTDPRQLIQTVVQNLQQTYNYYYVQVYLYDPTAQRLLLAGGTGEPGRLMLEKGHAVPRGRGLVGRAAQENHPVLVPDTALDPGWLRNPLLPETCTEIAVPIAIGEQVLGVLDVQHNIPNSLTGQAAEHLQTIANQVAIALQNARQYEQLEARTHALRISAEISRDLSTLLELQQIIQTVIQKVQSAFDYYHAQIYLYDPSGENLVLEAGTGEAGQAMRQAQHKIPSGRGLVGRAAQENQPVLVPDTAADPDWLPNPLLPETSAEIAVPISVGGLVLGVLDIQHSQVNALTAQDADLLQSIADQVAIALQNAQQYELLQTASRQTQQSESRFRSIYESSDDAIMLLTPQGFIDCNPRTLHLFAIPTKDQFIQLTPADLSPPLQPDGSDSLTASNEHIQAAYQHGHERFDWIHRQLDGPSFPAEVVIISSDYAGQPVLQATVRDITERYQLEQLQARQTRELAKVAEIAAAVASTLDPAELLQRVADLTKTGFDFYHAHIYLLDPTGQTLELAAGAGGIGRQMLTQTWRIPLDSPRSLVARTARQQTGLVVDDVTLEPDWLPNPLLPETFSEMAVPILAADRLLGVLDIQSETVSRFTETDVAIQTALASQVAVALQNARQYQQTRQSEQMVRTIIESTLDWIFIRDREYRYRLVNKSFADLLHMQSQDLIGKTEQELGLPVHEQEDRQILEIGQPDTYPNQTVMVDGQPRIFSIYRTPLFDEHNQPWAVLTFGRDVTENERLRLETEERLAEVDSLYKAMSRQAWQDFHAAGQRQTAFYYDRSAGLSEASAATAASAAKPGDHASLVTAPLALRGTPIGALGVQIDPHNPLTEDEQQLLNEFSEQIALALESARLFQQTQTTLAVTESLYAGSEQVLRSANIEDVLRAVILSTQLNRFERGSISLFDAPVSAATEEIPVKFTVVGIWEGSGGPLPQRLGTSVNLCDVPFIFAIRRDAPVFINDIQTDPRIDPQVLAMLTPLGRSLAVFPLVASGLWLGWIAMLSSIPIQIAESEIRQVQSLVSQAAAVVQGILLLQQTQTRARREQMLREITERLRSGMNPDTVLRTAVREVGAMLGRDVLIRLEQPSGPSAVGLESISGAASPDLESKSPDLEDLDGGKKHA